MSRINRLVTTLTASLCEGVPRETAVLVLGWLQVHWLWAIIKILRVNIPHGEVTYTHRGIYADSLLEVLPLDSKPVWTMSDPNHLALQDSKTPSLCSQ